MNGIGGKRTADGSAEKGAKMRGVAMWWVPSGNEWRIQMHQASGCGRDPPDAQFFFADAEDAQLRRHVKYYESTNFIALNQNILMTNNY